MTNIIHPVILIIAINHPYFFFTLTGDLFALWFRDKLRLISGFSAGSAIGVCLLDLLPESLKLGQGYFLQEVTVSVIALGFYCTSPRTGSRQLAS